MKIDNTPVSDNVVRIIKEKGYKQCAIARKAGYSRQVKTKNELSKRWKLMPETFSPR